MFLIILGENASSLIMSKAHSIIAESLAASSTLETEETLLGQLDQLERRNNPLRKHAQVRDRVKVGDKKLWVNSVYCFQSKQQNLTIEAMVSPIDRLLFCSLSSRIVDLFLRIFEVLLRFFDLSFRIADLFFRLGLLPLRITNLLLQFSELFLVIFGLLLWVTNLLFGFLDLLLRSFNHLLWTVNLS